MQMICPLCDSGFEQGERGEVTEGVTGASSTASGSQYASLMGWVYFSHHAACIWVCSNSCFASESIVVVIVSSDELFPGAMKYRGHESSAG